MEWIKQYKKRVLSRLISVEPSLLKEKIMDSEYYLLSEKLDGFYTVLVSKSSGIELYNKSGRALKIPNIQNLKLSPCILVGELCCYEDGVLKTHREVASAISKPEKSDLRFAAFDIIELKGQKIDGTAFEKYEILQKIASQTHCFTIPQSKVESRTEIDAFYQSVVDKDGEGIIVKGANEISYKIKPKITLDLVVLGFSEGNQERTGILRDLLLGIAKGKNQFQVVGSVGTGFSQNDRLSIYKDLSKMVVSSSFTEVSGAKTAFQMVKPEWVVEVTCLDILSENTHGIIKKPILSHSNQGYTVSEMQGGLSLVSAVFIRKRDDKIANEAHAGEGQVMDYRLPEGEDKTTQVQGDSRIEVREVYVKNSKNGPMVRKILGLKTNKEQSGLFSPYLVIFTDFSAGRAEPLDQEIKLCGSESELHKQIQALRDEHVKAGWTKSK